MVDLDKLIHDVIITAKSAGAFIRSQTDKIRSTDVETKGNHDYVTYVDKTAEEQIVKRLQTLLPEAGFIVEENTVSTQGAIYNWVVDPLDGTTNFIHGIPLFSVSIALMHYEEVVLGVIYEVNMDECFSAVRGRGAFLNGTPIQVSKNGELNNSLLATGFPYHDYSRLDSFMDFFRWCMTNTHGLRRLGSAALDLAYVACGRFEGFYEYGLNAWDVAAGCLIVKEAGGKVCDFQGKNNYIFGREVLASNPYIYNEFLNQIHQAFNTAD
jgi:myo-inositol-1(or 4)-monophosphatase